MSLAHTDTASARRARARPRAARRQANTPAARRQRKVRANRKRGFHHYGMWISDRAVEGLIMRLVLERRLTEAQALRPRLVALAIAQLLEEEGQRWAR
jgi:hypothetical protein